MNTQLKAYKSFEDFRSILRGLFRYGVTIFWDMIEFYFLIKSCDSVTS